MHGAANRRGPVAQNFAAGGQHAPESPELFPTRSMAELRRQKARHFFQRGYKAQSAFDVCGEQMKTHASVRSRLCAMERIIASNDWPRWSALSSKSRNNRARSARRIAG